MKLAITGGGSGGHTLPAVTVYDSFLEHYNDKDESFDCIYIGSYDGIEKDVAENKGIPYFSISTGKLRRYFSFKNLTDVLRILKGVLDSIFILRRFRPQAVFSTGGFVSVPVAVAAKLLRIPVVIHEQTSSVGLANKIASYFATKVACTFESSKKYFPPSKVIHTGQPIRKELFTGNKEECYTAFGLDEKLPLLYITGGSQGSHIINRTVKAILPDLLKECNIIHQCGRTLGHDDFEELSQYKAVLQKDLKKRYQVRDFIYADELKHILSAASLLLGRAGAGTVNEALALKIPSIFIPLAIATRNEQYYNAKTLVDLGGAVIIEESELSFQALKEKILSLFRNTEKRNVMVQSLQSSSKQDAGEEILKLILGNIRGE